jgi:sugar lactone lactonase YvrE
VPAACGEPPRPPASAADCRRAELVVEGDGRAVVGVEDLAIDPARGVAWLSAYDRRRPPSETAGPRPSGGIYRLDLDGDLRSGRLTVADATAAFAADAPFYPHGIDLLAAPGGGATLAAINRRYEAGPAAPGRGDVGGVTVELFAVSDAGLAHRRTLADPALCRANDLLLLGPDRLLVAADQAACAGWRVWLERATAFPGGHLLLWRDGEARIVADGIPFANGIARAGDRVAVAATRAQRLFHYGLGDLTAAADDRSPWPGGGAPARPVAQVALPGGPDNLARGADGRLYAALLPDLFRQFLFQRGWAETAPSRVVRLAPGAGTPADMLVDAETPLLAGVTVAAAHGDRLIAGSAWDAGLMICRLATGGRPR